MRDRITWLIKSIKLRKSHLGFFSHWSAFCDREVQLSEYNSIGRRCRLSGCSIGRFTYITSDTKITRAKIGAFCSIGQEVIIGGLASHPLDWISTHPAFYSSLKQSNYSFVERSILKEQGNVVIGNDVWIGARAMVIDGCNIGNGAVIAAGAVVVGDVPAYAIVGGIPAKVIRFRFPQEKINEIEASQWWSYSLEKLSKIRRSAIHGSIREHLNQSEM